MRVRSVLVALAAVALLVPATAAAKGASEATLKGPGLDSPLTIRGEGSYALGRIADSAGIYPGLFGQSPDPMLPAKPGGDLGPKYTMTWGLHGPNGVNRVRQDIYPYAVGGPVTFTPSGQRVFGTERSLGGWYRASLGLRDYLVDVGLPAKAPKASSGNGRAYAFAGAGAAALLLAAGGAFALRRKQSGAK
jgi:hypothetical protein